MSVLDTISTALVIAPHPDDEILGCGGTIARLTAMGRRVEVVIVTTGMPPTYSADSVAATRAEAVQAHQQLGIAATHWLEFPAAGLDQVPKADLNAALSNAVAVAKPDALFLPFLGDVHVDHQIVFTAAMVAARPRTEQSPRLLLAYETLSETNWYAPGLTPTFAPDVYIDISQTLEAKLAAFGQFRSQVQEFPAERSPEALRALATLRGATVYRQAAEAFVLLRAIW